MVNHHQPSSPRGFVFRPTEPLSPPRQHTHTHTQYTELRHQSQQSQLLSHASQHSQVSQQSQQNLFQHQNPQEDPESFSISQQTSHSHSRSKSRGLLLNPYPQWVTQLSRSILAIIEVGSMGYGCFFLVRWQPTRGFPTKKYELAVATFGVSMALDLGAVIFSTCQDQKRGKWGYIMLVILVDLSIGIMGLLGALRVYMIEEERVETGRGEDRWERMGRFVGVFAVVVGGLHILAGLAGFLGCCIVNLTRPRRRKPRSGWVEQHEHR